MNAIQLNALAWFNYGVSLKDDKDFESAFTAFLTVACIQDWDKEAWKNCFLIYFNLKKTEAMSLIYNVITDKFGAESIIYIADHILNDAILDKDIKLKLVKAIADLAMTKNK